MSQSNDRTAILAALIRKFFNGSANTREIAFLISHAEVYAHRALSKRFKHLFMKLGPDDSKGVVKSAVAEFFGRTGKNESILVRLRDALALSDAELVTGFNRHLAFVANQHLNEVWKVTDRASYAVHDRLRRVFYESETLYQWDDGVNGWITLKVNKEKGYLNLKAEPMPMSEIAIGLSQLRLEPISLKSVIEQFFEELSADRRYQWFVWYEDLRDALLEQEITEESFDEAVSSTALRENPRLRMAVEKGLVALRRFVSDKVAHYKNDEKLNQTEASAYEKAIEELAYQWIHDGFTDKNYVYYEYLSAQLRNMTPEQFKNPHKTKFQYVTEEAKKFLLVSIRKNYGK